MGCATSASDPMSQESLAFYIEEIAGSAEISPNVVEFEYRGVSIASVSDTTHNRMRLIAPITSRNAVAAEHLEMMLIANFHTALDARYALSNGIIYAVFLHPMSTLTHDQLESAIRQVAALARNFGSSYSSDELIFGVESGEKT
jgi:hypothetical protein